uniref:Uncharacterized protein n=1 Tax=Arundo donax TaxID=35708 RepID=A0A0A9FAD7_ARUDO
MWNALFGCSNEYMTNIVYIKLHPVPFLCNHCCLELSRSMRQP